MEPAKWGLLSFFEPGARYHLPKGEYPSPQRYGSASAIVLATGVASSGVANLFLYQATQCLYLHLRVLSQSKRGPNLLFVGRRNCITWPRNPTHSRASIDAWPPRACGEKNPGSSRPGDGPEKMRRGRGAVTPRPRSIRTSPEKVLSTDHL